MAGWRLILAAPGDGEGGLGVVDAKGRGAVKGWRSRLGAGMGRAWVAGWVRKDEGEGKRVRRLQGRGVVPWPGAVEGRRSKGVGMGLLLDGGAQPGGGDPGLEIGDAPTGKMERGVRLQVVGIEEILRGLGWD